VYKAPAPYVPRAQETDIYAQLKALLANPDSFSETDYFKNLMAQGDNAFARSRQGSRFSGKTFAGFQEQRQRNAANTYSNRLQQLLGGSGEERTRGTNQEGAERAAYGMNADTGYRGFQGQMEGWKANLGAQTQTYGARLSDAWNRDKNASDVQGARLSEYGMLSQPGARANNPEFASRQLKDWGFDEPASWNKTGASGGTSYGAYGRM
jgi:hypothetical protein